MKKLVRLLIVLAIVVVAVGFYRGWFTLSSHKANDGSDNVNVNLTMDADKIRDDATAVKKKSAELTDNAIGKEKDAEVRPADSGRAPQTQR
jgi:hypothetical protein